MKINDNREQAMQSFQSLRSIGEVFEYENEIFMTIEEVKDVDEQPCNAVCLNDGELAYFNKEHVLVLNNVALEIH